MFNVHDVLHKRLHLRAFKIQMTHALKPSEQVACKNFVVDMLEGIDVSPNFLCQVCFSDKVMFHVNGVVNRYNCRICASQNPRHMWVEERQDQSERVGRLNARQVDWTVFLFGKDCGQTFVLGQTGVYVLPQLPPKTILQQDGTPPHFCQI
jgi:hypothetical protein